MYGTASNATSHEGWYFRAYQSGDNGYDAIIWSNMNFEEVNSKVTPTEANLTVNVGTNLTQYGWGGSKVRKIGSLLIYTLAINSAPTTAKLTPLATIPNGFKPISDRAFGAGGTGTNGDEPVTLLIDTSRNYIMATGETKGFITGTIICYAG